MKSCLSILYISKNDLNNLTVPRPKLTKLLHLLPFCKNAVLIDLKPRSCKNKIDLRIQTACYAAWSNLLAYFALYEAVC